MSNTIGFKNFRRFQYFPEINLGDITILVGGNNAGKSTLVKAMLLMRDFLKSRIESSDNSKINNTSKRPQFGFDTEHVNIGDFYRAFCRQSPRREETISFTMKIDKFRFVVNIRGERKPSVIPEVSLITVSDENEDITFTFDFLGNQMTAHFGVKDLFSARALNDEKYLRNKKEELTMRLYELNKILVGSKNFEIITATKADIERVQMELNRVQLNLKQIELDLYKKDKALKNEGYNLKVYGTDAADKYFYKCLNAGKLLIPQLIKGFARFANEGTIGDKNSDIFKEEEANKTFLRGKVAKLEEISEEIESVLNKQVIEYIYAHSVYQDSVYANCANSSDYTKRTIHEFYTSRISRGDIEFSLIEKWLERFKIGNSLKVIPYKGDNYSLVIFDKENSEVTGEKRKDYPGGIELADKGMGSIQIVILLLRLATLIRKYRGQELTVLLEEPEQNLHPAMQSKIAELVHCVNIDFGINFIIETHSEYLIRKTQVIVAEQNKTQNKIDNPFKVIYLPDNNEPPYDMQYRPDGKFSKEFGAGFFDEAAKLAFKIF